MKLAPESTIGVVGCSSPLQAPEADDCLAAIRQLESKGYRLLIGKTAFASEGYRTATIADRVTDIERMIQDRVSVILSTTGGYNCNEMLEFLDWKLIEQNPVPLVGYSDMTALALPLHARAGVRTVSGPMLIDHPHDEQALDRLITFLEQGKPDLSLPPLLWEGKDEPIENTPPIQVLPRKEESASGSLIAANLSTFNLLLATPYLPPMKDILLFLEYDCEESHALPSLQRLLWQIRQAGVFKDIGALVFGRLPAAARAEETPERTIREILAEVTNGYSFPVLFDAPFGHLYPSWILPNGAHLSVEKNKIQSEE